MVYAYRWVCDGCGDVKTVFTDIKKFETPDTFECQEGCDAGVYRRSDKGFVIDDDPITEKNANQS